MRDLQTIAPAAGAVTFDTDQTADLFVQTAMLAQANAVRVEPVIRRRLGQPLAFLVHVEVGHVAFLLSETGAHTAMRLLCAAAKDECYAHLVTTALLVGGAIADGRSMLGCAQRGQV